MILEIWNKTFKYLNKEWAIKKILQNMNIKRYYNKMKQGVC
jgi:hypothetical protein